MQEQSTYTFVKIPKEFECPITHEMMTDPVFTADGETYERQAIMKWLQTHNTSRHTNEVLEHKHLTENRHLKSQIQQFFQTHIVSFKKEFLAAVKKNHREKLQVLLNLGVPMNAEVDGYTGPLYAILYGYKDMALWFLKDRVSPSLLAIDHKNDTQLSMAIACRNQKLKSEAKIAKKELQTKIEALYKKINEMSGLIGSYEKLYQSLKTETSAEKVEQLIIAHPYTEIPTSDSCNQWNQMSIWLGIRKSYSNGNPEEMRKNIDALKKTKAELEKKRSALEQESWLLQTAFNTESLILKNKYNMPSQDFSSLEKVRDYRNKNIFPIEKQDRYGGYYYGSQNARGSYPKLSKVKAKIAELDTEIRKLEENLNLQQSYNRESYNRTSKMIGYEFKSQMNRIREELNHAPAAYQKKIAELLTVYDELAKLYEQRKLLKFETEKTTVQLVHLAAFLGQEDVLQQLLQNGADVNAQDEFGFTALHWAAIQDQKPCVEILLAYKAQEQKDNFGYTFHHYANPEWLKDIHARANKDAHVALEDKIKAQGIELNLLKAQVENLTGMMRQLMSEGKPADVNAVQQKVTQRDSRANNANNYLDVASLARSLNQVTRSSTISEDPQRPSQGGQNMGGQNKVIPNFQTKG